MKNDIRLQEQSMLDMHVREDELTRVVTGLENALRVNNNTTAIGRSPMRQSISSRPVSVDNGEENDDLKQRFFFTFSLIVLTHSFICTTQSQRTGKGRFLLQK